MTRKRYIQLIKIALKGTEEEEIGIKLLKDYPARDEEEEEVRNAIHRIIMELSCVNTLECFNLQDFIQEGNSINSLHYEAKQY